MKKLIAMILSAVLVLGLCACGGNAQEDEQVITRATEAATAPAAPVETEAVSEAAEAKFADFQFEGKELNVGSQFDPSVLPEANSVYQVPSCAIEGTDNVYSYDLFEITAYDDGTNELIYSIYFMTPDVQTPEGLALGDEMAKMVQLYGENYEQVGTACNYYCGDAMLSVLVQNDVVISIEYKMVTE